MVFYVLGFILCAACAVWLFINARNRPSNRTTLIVLGVLSAVVALVCLALAGGTLLLLGGVD